ncbi:hypothetical protein EDC30_105186 [Paucimonas lemoignei]|uniref:Uncharacterized protein n=1 Tax=Paucimonas lemoignei TaxID=29443 RepID=A0A4R3HW08_PAULE|nr:hypothetical protein EDC30_105186 [Paucimonas lemoignei]
MLKAQCAASVRNSAAFRSVLVRSVLVEGLGQTTLAAFARPYSDRGTAQRARKSFGFVPKMDYIMGSLRSTSQCRMWLASAARANLPRALRMTMISSRSSMTVYITMQRPASEM